MKKTKISLSIEEKYLNIILNRIDNSDDFETIDDYVNFIFSEIFSDEIQEKEVEEELKKMGYM